MTPALSTVLALHQPNSKKPLRPPVMLTYWNTHRERLEPQYKAYQARTQSAGRKGIHTWNSFVAESWSSEPAATQEQVRATNVEQYADQLELWVNLGAQPMDANTQKECDTFPTPTYKD